MVEVPVIRVRFIALTASLLSLASPMMRANASVAPVRLYAMDCGWMDVGDMGRLFSDTGEYAGEPGRIADPCFLIRHPNGLLLWDAGLGDRISENKDGVDMPAFGTRLTVPRTLADQLASLDIKASDITYLAFSHFHLDHTGNAGLFSSAQWIVNNAELATAEETPLSPGLDPAFADAVKRARKTVIAGDHDVFGDGSVWIRQTPGHTPGHQSLEIRLEHAGTVLLTGDLYHLRNNRTLGLVAAVNYNRAATLASIDRFERIAKNTNARVVIQHDAADFLALPRFPLYLD
jgi:glyoxylase-like metal-dependent hydrolase (beta-lactamase superfamily II)